MLEFTKQPYGIGFTGDALEYGLRIPDYVPRELYFVQAVLYADGEEVVSETKPAAASLSFGLGAYARSLFPENVFPAVAAKEAYVEFHEYHGTGELTRSTCRSMEITLLPGYLPEHFTQNPNSLLDTASFSQDGELSPGEYFTVSLIDSGKYAGLGFELETVDVDGTKEAVRKNSPHTGLSVYGFSVAASAGEIRLRTFAGTEVLDEFSHRVVTKPEATATLLFRSPQCIFKTLYATGELTQQGKYERELHGDNEHSFLAGEETAYTLNTGFVRRGDHGKVRELLLSEEVYLIRDGQRRRIVQTTAKDVKLSTEDPLYYALINFYYSPVQRNLCSFVQPV